MNWFVFVYGVLTAICVYHVVAALRKDEHLAAAYYSLIGLAGVALIVHEVTRG